MKTGHDAELPRAPVPDGLAEHRHSSIIAVGKSGKAAPIASAF
jgi:hypothetical protein